MFLIIDTKCVIFDTRQNDTPNLKVYNVIKPLFLVDLRIEYMKHETKVNDNMLKHIMKNNIILKKSFRFIN